MFYSSDTTAVCQQFCTHLKKHMTRNTFHRVIVTFNVPKKKNQTDPKRIRENKLIRVVACVMAVVNSRSLTSVFAGT